MGVLPTRQMFTFEVDQPCRAGELVRLRANGKVSLLIDGERLREGDFIVIEHVTRPSLIAKVIKANPKRHKVLT